MIILGINCFSHDTSACILVDGKLLAFAEEERFNRDKHTKRFPFQSINYCLETAGIEVEAVDLVGLAHKPGLDFTRAMLDILRRLPRSWRRLFIQPAVDLSLYLKKPFFRLAQGYTGKVVFVGHHEAHAAAAFFASPFDEAAVLSIDRGGDYLSTWLGVGKGNSLQKLGAVRQPHSLGEVYAAVTDYLGFRPNSDEGKVMGLAPYGDKTYFNKFKRLLKSDNKGGFKVDLNYFTYYLKQGWYDANFISQFGPKRLKGEEIGLRHKDIAAAVQHVTERTGLGLANFLSKTTKSKNLCLSGGVTLNSCMNAYILKNSDFEDIFIQPAAGDAGNALGAAYYLWHCVLGNERVEPMAHAFLGPEFSNEEIQAALETRGLNWQKLDDIENQCARRLADGKIVGWFQGRSEVGPRALGNRSILANATLPETKDIVNLKIKKRESFRPFAPAIMEEYAADYIDDYYPSPYMLLVQSIKKSLRTTVPSITHVDGTSRTQSVSKQTNPRFWKLIDSFRKESGVPVVLNTSFNVQGEPIVLTPFDAISTFKTSGMDCLAMGDYLVEKDQ